MSEQLTDSDLELIEARAKYAAALEHTILGSYVERHDWPSTDDDKIVIHRSTALWLVAALRAAWAENDRLRVSGVGRRYDRPDFWVDPSEYDPSDSLPSDRSAASDEATGGGG